MEYYLGYIVLGAVALGVFVLVTHTGERQVPAPENESILIWREYTKYFYVAGTLYHDFDIVKRKRLVKDKSTYSMKREPDNRHDPNAIAVYINEYKVGYVPRNDAKVLAPQMDRGDVFTLYLSEYNPRSKYEQLEIEAVNETLKLKLDPNGFHFNTVREL